LKPRRRPIDPIRAMHAPDAARIACRRSLPGLPAEARAMPRKRPRDAAP